LKTTPWGPREARGQAITEPGGGGGNEGHFRAGDGKVAELFRGLERPRIKKPGGGGGGGAARGDV